MCLLLMKEFAAFAGFLRSPGHVAGRGMGYGARVGLPRESGYFPPGESVLRQVHGERAVGLLYGQRALLMQATDPLAFTGLIGNTGGLHAPFERLARTAQLMEKVYFGTRQEADRVS